VFTTVNGMPTLTLYLLDAESYQLSSDAFTVSQTYKESQCGEEVTNFENDNKSGEFYSSITFVTSISGRASSTVHQVFVIVGTVRSETLTFKVDIIDRCSGVTGFDASTAFMKVRNEQTGDEKEVMLGTSSRNPLTYTLLDAPITIEFMGTIGMVGTIGDCKPMQYWEYPTKFTVLQLETPKKMKIESATLKATGLEEHMNIFFKTILPNNLEILVGFTLEVKHPCRDNEIKITVVSNSFDTPKDLNAAPVLSVQARSSSSVELLVQRDFEIVFVGLED